jgi:hypothetical protein
MKRRFRLRSIFTARRGSVLYVGPEHIEEPRYMPKVEELIRRHQAELKPGTVWEARVAHDSWCPALAGGTCGCDPDVELVPTEE